MVLFLVCSQQLADVRRAKAEQDLGLALRQSIGGEIFGRFLDFLDGCLLPL